MQLSSPDQQLVKMLKHPVAQRYIIDTYMPLVRQLPEKEQVIIDELIKAHEAEEPVLFAFIAPIVALTLVSFGLIETDRALHVLYQYLDVV